MAFTYVSLIKLKTESEFPNVDPFLQFLSHPALINHTQLTLTVLHQISKIVFEYESRSCAGKRNGLYEKKWNTITTTYGIKIKIKK